MQFSTILTGLVSVLAGTAAAAKLDLRVTAPKAMSERSVIDACVPENDCCFSTSGACNRQSNGWAERYLQCPFYDLCPKLGVSVQACNADCCSIGGKAGRGCPGK